MHVNELGNSGYYAYAPLTLVAFSAFVIEIFNKSAVNGNVNTKPSNQSQAGAVAKGYKLNGTGRQSRQLENLTGDGVGFLSNKSVLKV